MVEVKVRIHTAVEVATVDAGPPMEAGSTATVVTVGTMSSKATFGMDRVKIPRTIWHLVNAFPSEIAESLLHKRIMEMRAWRVKVISIAPRICNLLGREA
jgi:hypothetical protein